MKKTFFLTTLFILGSLLFAQQITKFAVVDTAKIYTTFPRNSRQARSYEEKKEKHQMAIKKMSEEIVALRQKKVDADAAGKTALVDQLEKKIASKTDFLLEYTQSSNAELSALSQKLVNDDRFYSLLYDTIKLVAEREGYSMVLSLQETGSILWFSPSVDLTDKIIRELRVRQ